MQSISRISCMTNYVYTFKFVCIFCNWKALESPSLTLECVRSSVLSCEMPYYTLQIWKEISKAFLDLDFHIPLLCYASYEIAKKMKQQI